MKKKHRSRTLERGAQHCWKKSCEEKLQHLEKLLHQDVGADTHAWLCAAVQAARQHTNFEGILMYILYTFSILNRSIIFKMPFEGTY